MKKECGILMPVFSLPGEYGTGTFGKESYDFIDFLKKSKHTVWQTLPLGQTTYGDSPYQTTGDSSLNPYFTDLEDLFARGLITAAELKREKRTVGKVDYARLYKSRYALLKKAYSRYIPTDEFLAFVNGGSVKTFALFTAAKAVYGELANFPDKLKRRDKRAIDEFLNEHYDEYLFYTFIQFILRGQYDKLKNYAAKAGIKIMGDLPLYVAADGAEVWENPSQFCVDENLAPVKVAGVPPDYFSADGQLWGNPVYDYARMREDGYKWWKKRLKFALDRYDLVRIDHFRGLDRFWAIPYGEKAVNGEWEKADGKEFLLKFPRKKLVAEDLGTIDDGVRELLKVTGLRGMKVLLFAFDGNAANPYLPENIDYNSVSYVGTHDNDTAYGYIKSANKAKYAYLRKEVAKRLNRPLGQIKSKRALTYALTDLLYSIKSQLVISSFADLCALGNEYRINEPSTLGNWRVRFKKELFTDELAARLALLAASRK